MRPVFLLLISLLSLLPACSTFKKDPKVIITVFSQGSDMDNPKTIFRRPIAGKQVVFKVIPEFTEKSVVAFHPFDAQDGTHGVALKLDFKGTNAIELATRMRDTSIALYRAGAAIAAARGIIIADTKFEFGLDADGTMLLMDEVLTPDSSRFWPVESYAEGGNPPSYDKQFVRDWLEQLRIDGAPWNKRPPAPQVPAEVLVQTAARYREALQRLAA